MFDWENMIPKPRSAEELRKAALELQKERPKKDDEINHIDEC